MFGLHFLLTKVDLYLSMTLFHREYLISLALIPQYVTHCLLLFSMSSLPQSMHFYQTSFSLQNLSKQSLSGLQFRA